MSRLASFARRAERVFRRGLRTLVSRLSGHRADRYLEQWDEARMRRVSARGAARLAALGGREGLRLHLGAGGDIRAGWVNVDLSFSVLPGPRHAANGEPAEYVSLDLRGGLPLPDGCCEYVYSSHFFEHLDLAAGTRLLRECHRVLAPGGTFRVSLPDFRACCAAYVRGDGAFFDLIDTSRVVPGLERGSESLVDAMNYVVYQHGEHRCMYDSEKMQRLLRHVGFASAAAAEFDPAIDPGSEERRRYSFYVAATR